MAETIIEPSAAAQPAPATVAEPPVDPDFASAFSLALDQEREAPPTPQMQQALFEGAFAKAMEQTRAADLTWPHMAQEFGRTALTTAEEILGKGVAGTERTLGLALDPEKRFSAQSIPQLIDGIGTAQDQLNALRRSMDEEPSEYTYDRAEVKITALQSDIAAMRRVLNQRSGQPEPEQVRWDLKPYWSGGAQLEPWTVPAQPIQAVGAALIGEAAKTEQFTKEQTGQAPLPPPQNWFEQFDRWIGAFTHTNPAPLDPFFQETVPGRIARLGGQGLAFFGAGGEGLPGIVTEAVPFVGGGFEERYEQAIAAGKTPEEAARSGYESIPLSVAQMAAFRLPVGNLLKAAEGKFVGDVTKNLIRNVGVGAALGTTQTIYNNVLDQLNGIDPGRPWTAGLQDSVIDNVALMTVGGLVHDVSSVVLRRSSRPDIDPYGGTPRDQSARPATEAPPAAAPPVTTPVPIGAPAAEAPSELPVHASAIPTDEAYREARLEELERGLGTPPEAPGPAVATPIEPAPTAAPPAEPLAETQAAGQATQGPPEQTLAAQGTPEQALARETAAFAQTGVTGVPEAVPVAPVVSPRQEIIARGVEPAETAAPSPVAQPAAPSAPPAGASEPYAIQRLREINPEAADRYGKMSPGEQTTYLEQLHSSNPEWNPDSPYFQGANMRRDIGAQPSMPEAAPLSAEPVTRRGIRQMAADLVRRIGPRANVLMADEKSLPTRYRKALADHGLTPQNFKAFYDRALDEMVINPKNITNQAELNDIMLRKMLPNTFADKARIVPIDSWASRVDSPAVARLLTRDPRADTTTSALYDPTSGSVFFNIPKISRSLDPLGHGVELAVHEIGVHQGLRNMFGADYAAYDSLLDRVYNSMVKTGAGDQIAAQFGTNMEGLARTYNLGTQARDGTWTMTPTQNRRLAEELLARYAERYDPLQLEKAPTVLQRAVSLIQDGIERFQGVKLTRAQTFKTLRDAWHAAQPPRDPASKTALAAREIIKSYASTDDERQRAESAQTAELETAARATAGGGDLQPHDGRPVTDDAIRTSSDRIGAIARGTRLEYTQGTLSSSAPWRIRGAEADVRFPTEQPEQRYVYRVSRPDSEFGPYGVAPEFQDQPTGAERPGTEAGGARAVRVTEQVRPNGYAGGRATADQYTERLRLSNILFDSGNELEGYMHDPNTGLWRLITSQPLAGEMVPPTISEIADYMAARGFQPLNDREYYDPSRKIVVLNADPTTITKSGDTGNLVVFDAAPFNVTGRLAEHLDNVTLSRQWRDRVADPEGLAAQLRAHGVDVEAAHAALQARAPEEPEALRAVERQFVADEQELARLRDVAKDRELTPGEQDRLDSIEMGPLLARDIERELGPDSPDDPPIDILRRAIETQNRANPPEKGIRVHALRTSLDPKEVEAVRLANAAEDQRQYDKAGEKFWGGVVERIVADFGGDHSKVINALIDNQFQRLAPDVQAQIYEREVKEIRGRRRDAAAADDQTEVQRLDGVRISLDEWANRDRTEAGKWLASWQNVLHGLDGVMSNFRSGYQRAVRKRVERDSNYGSLVGEVLKLNERVSREALDDQAAKAAMVAAQRAHEAAEPRAMHERIADVMTEAVARALELAGKKAAVPDPMLRTFEETIKQRIRDQLPMLARKPIERPSATETLRALMRRWGNFEQVFQGAIDSMRHGMDPGRLGLFVQELNRNLDVPFTESQLKRAISEQKIDVRDLVRAHWSKRKTTLDSLADVLTRDTNLTPEQAKLVQDKISNIINSKITETTTRELQRLIDQTNGGKATPQAKSQAMKRLLDLIHMGAFSREEVSDALGVLFGFDKGYLPEINAELQPLADEFERLKSQGRAGIETEEVRMQMLRTLANYEQLTRSRYWMNLLAGNLISGLPSHTVAFINELLSGSVNLAGLYRRTAQLRDPGASARLMFDSMRELGSGLWKSLPEAGYTLRTGVYPTRFMTREDLERSEMPIWRKPGPFEQMPTGEYLGRLGGKIGLETPFSWAGRIAVDYPISAVFRGTTALHSIIHGGFGRATEHMLAVRLAAKEGLPLNEAIDKASQMLYDPGGTRHALEQQVANEGLSGVRAQMRLDQLLGEQLPKQLLSEADYWGTEANNLQKPYGLLGIVEGGLSSAARKNPWLRQFFPFLRIPANLLNMSLDMSPVGFWRYLHHEGYLLAGEREISPAAGEKYITQERYDELRGAILTRALIGTSLMAAAGALPQVFPWLKIHGAGPATPDEKNQLRESGWQPYSIQIGNNYYPFEYLPAWFGLAAVGNFYDSWRYSKSGVMPTPEQALWRSIAVSPNTLFDRSFLRGLYDLMDAIHRAGEHPETGLDTIEAYLANQVGHMTPVAGMIGLQQAYQQFIDDKYYKAKGWASLARSWPFIAPSFGLKPKLNALGEPVEPGGEIAGAKMPIIKRFWTGGINDKVWEFLNERRVWLGLPTNAKILGKAMTDEQLYDYTAFRGQHLRQMIGRELSTLKSIKDDDELKKEMGRIEKEAHDAAVGEVLSHKKPVFH